MTYNNRYSRYNDTKRIPYTAEEREALTSAQAQFDNDEDVPDLEWTASNGSRIQIFRDSNGFVVSIDGSMTYNNVLSDNVPANSNGIVAKIGRVGLTAERKAAIEGLRKWGK